MKAAFILIVIFLLICASCRTPQSSATNAVLSSTPEVSTQSGEPIQQQKPATRCETNRENTERDEVETSAGAVKVWTKTKRSKTDEIKIKDELYYQIANKKPMLIAATEWNGYFKNICLSPNGKWATAFFYYEVRGLFNDVKTSEHPLLINLENKDFIDWDDIKKRLSKPSDGKQIYILGWQADKSAAIIYKIIPETTVFVDLPDKLPTPRQNLYQATGYEER